MRFGASLAFFFFSFYLLVISFSFGKEQRIASVRWVDLRVSWSVLQGSFIFGLSCEHVSCWFGFACRVSGGVFQCIAGGLL